MTVNTTISRTDPLNGDAVSTVFPVPFYFLANTDLLVYVGGVLQTLTTHYSVSGAGNAAGGSVTFVTAPPAGTGNVVIVREVDLLQSTKYPANDPFPARTHETALDKLTMLAQRTRDLIKRSFTLADFSTAAVSLAIPDPVAAKFLRWNASATGLENADLNSGGIGFPVSFAQGGTNGNYANAAAVLAGLGAAPLASPALTGTPTAPTPAAGTSNTQIATTAFAQVAAAAAPLRSYLAGLGMSTAGASATMTIAPGQATDDGNTVSMNLPAAISKTTSAWAVGTGNGGLDTGSIANNTWYHFFEIMRTDTGAVDVLCSLSASAPTMPANYSKKRRIGSGLTDGSAKWTAFVQDGDFFQWVVPANETFSITTTTPTLRALTKAPIGISVIARCYAEIGNSAGPMSLPTHWDPALGSVYSASAGVSGRVFVSTGVSQVCGNNFDVRTNTSAQIYNNVNGVAWTSYALQVLGWFDRRGRDA